MRIEEIAREPKGKQMLEGLVTKSQTLVHRWHVDIGHADRTPELTALLNVRNPTTVPTYVALLEDILGQLDEADIQALEAEPVLQACLCANRNVVKMATVSHNRTRTKYAGSADWRIGTESALMRALEPSMRRRTRWAWAWRWSRATSSC